MAKHILTANVRRLVTIYETLSLSAVPRSTPIREGMMSLVRRDFLFATERTVVALVAGPWNGGSV
jgi:hypothetical protein